MFEGRPTDGADEVTPQAVVGVNVVGEGRGVAEHLLARLARILSITERS